MKTLIRLGCCLLAVCAASLLRGDELPTRGKVLLLDNERTLEGEIVRYGDQYALQRTIGETWIPASKVLCLCQTHEEAYQVLRGRANLADPDERLRLARWCQKYDLRVQAIEEASAAVQLRPNNAEARRLLNYALRPATPTPGVEAKEPEGPATPLAPIELGTEAMSQFVTKVQPILMNACASCHATGQGGAFKIARGVSNGPASQKTTQQNLASVLAQVNLEQPQTSALLVKSITIHGEASQPPLKGRQVAAYHTLENWVRLTAARNPHLKDQVNKTAVSTSLERKSEQVTREARSTNWAADAPPKAPPKTIDPFDPAAFNRQMHPPVKPKQ